MIIIDKNNGLEFVNALQIKKIDYNLKERKND